MLIVALGTLLLPFWARRVEGPWPKRIRVLGIALLVLWVVLTVTGGLLEHA